MSLARSRGQANSRGTAGNTITKFGKNVENLPATQGGATGKKNPERGAAGIAKYEDVLTPGGQKNP